MLYQARKFLPYGFGPGAKTVILDVGSVDDDEEDYGDYQVSPYIVISQHYNLSVGYVILISPHMRTFKFTVSIA